MKNKLVPVDTMLAILYGATEHLDEIHSQFDHSMDDVLEDFYSNMDKLPNHVRRSLKIWKPEQIKSRYRKIIKNQIREMKHSELSKHIHFKKGDEGFSAAFDLTEVKYYGDNAENLEFMNTSTKKGGSKYCYLYLTLQVLCPGFRLILDAEPIYKDSDPIGKIMLSMLKRVKRAGMKIYILLYWSTLTSTLS